MEASGGDGFLAARPTPAPVRPSRVPRPPPVPSLPRVSRFRPCSSYTPTEVYVSRLDNAPFAFCALLDGCLCMHGAPLHAVPHRRPGRARTFWPWLRRITMMAPSSIAISKDSWCKEVRDKGVPGCSRMLSKVPQAFHRWDMHG
eukprot:365455-Chlamydomonas_euryale.AAC.16